MDEETKAPEKPQNTTERIHKCLEICYKNRDKLAILVGAGIFTYYAVATLKELFIFSEMLSQKYYQTCDNLMCISDYLRDIKRCEICNKAYKREKCLRRHMFQHEIREEIDRWL